MKKCPKCEGEMEEKINSVSNLASEFSKTINFSKYLECKNCGYKTGGED
ncbi:hypothetical protein M1146_01835 [Patescibacteria group bacterium]|nr:hypothetical protein [Patescibacteria group bacterium]